jgi:hypothetical protein
MSECLTSLPSRLLGLLDADQTRAWFSGHDVEWKIDMAKVATEGPAGICLAHVTIPSGSTSASGSRMVFRHRSNNVSLKRLRHHPQRSLWQ